MNEDLFVDTNVFLRFLTRDDPRKADDVRALFQAAIDGRLSLVTSVLVIAEIVWTLESFYQLEKTDIAEKVEIILDTPNLVCSEGDLLRKALDIYAAKNVDFIDAYHAIYLKDQEHSRIVTYDRKHFRRFAGLEIVEPGQVENLLAKESRPGDDD